MASRFSSAPIACLRHDHCLDHAAGNRDGKPPRTRVAAQRSPPVRLCLKRGQAVRSTRGRLQASPRAGRRSVWLHHQPDRLDCGGDRASAEGNEATRQQGNKATRQRGVASGGGRVGVAQFSVIMGRAGVPVGRAGRGLVGVTGHAGLDRYSLRNTPAAGEPAGCRSRSCGRGRRAGRPHYPWRPAGGTPALPEHGRFGWRAGRPHYPWRSWTVQCHRLGQRERLEAGRSPCGTNPGARGVVR